ncbi:DUF2637 domain-containing protein [Microlunatus sp. GCM10028923]|uniref:DUF2637 domain-containing protein n=1 Tax=Microlunatus sp. GCM10028923 TaxID=3273400 RepID=UPI00361B4733
MITEQARRWSVATAVAGTVFIAAGAFWLSFTALRDLASRSGIDPGQAWAWPLIVDGIIVTATVAVVALAGHRSVWYPWTLLAGGAAVSVTANALHAVVASDGTVPRVLAAAVASVPPVVLLAITHLTVILTRASRRPDEGPATSRRASSAVEPAVEPSRPQPPSRIGHRGVVPSAGVSSAARRNQAASLRDQGWSNKAIATELSVHPSTVGRWFADSAGSTPITQTHLDKGVEAQP